jgi:hypothetical protein
MSIQDKCSVGSCSNSSDFTITVHAIPISTGFFGVYSPFACLFPSCDETVQYLHSTSWAWGSVVSYLVPYRHETVRFFSLRLASPCFALHRFDLMGWDGVSKKDRLFGPAQPRHQDARSSRAVDHDRDEICIGSRILITDGLLFRERAT